MFEPKRGEVWMVDLGLAAKVRPCLILNIPVQENEKSLITIVTHTTSTPLFKFVPPTICNQ
jgi:mRNA interferase MazF